jgi:hypothetical protein
VENKTAPVGIYRRRRLLISPAGRRIAVVFFARGGENRRR